MWTSRDGAEPNKGQPCRGVVRSLSDQMSCQLVSFFYHARMENGFSNFHRFAVDLHLLTKHWCCRRIPDLLPFGSARGQSRYDGFVRSRPRLLTSVLKLKLHHLMRVLRMEGIPAPKSRTHMYILFSKEIRHCVRSRDETQLVLDVLCETCASFHTAVRALVLRSCSRWTTRSTVKSELSSTISQKKMEQTDKRCKRELTGFIRQAADYTQYCQAGNTVIDCTSGSFQDAHFAGNMTDSKICIGKCAMHTWKSHNESILGSVKKKTSVFSQQHRSKQS